ncbi:hypothetical protein [Microcoleus asticus]|uniref:hypothetical protein n=1 Tax=Microcoleus asticus TaxID=2815231 RepID=UPI001557AAE7|nr:hypothetical protein [Microcoleus asticus]
MRYIWENRKSKRKEEGRRKKEEGRRKKEDGRRKTEDGRSYLLVATNFPAQLPIKNYATSL